MKIIQKLEELPNFTDAKALVFDTETSGLSIHHGDRICGFAIGARDTEPFYIPIRHVNEGAQYRNMPSENIFKWLRPLLADPNRKWIGHNLKYDLHALRADGLELEGQIVDTMVLAHVVRGDWFKYSLDVCTQVYAPMRPVHAERLEEYLKATQKVVTTEEGKSDKNYSLVPIDILGPYACEDIASTAALLEALGNEKILSAPAPYNFGNPAWSVAELVANEMDLVKVIFEMEWVGVKIDMTKCLQLKQQALEEVEVLQDKLYQIVGGRFSLESWKDRWQAFERAGGEILFWGARKEERGKQKLQQFTQDRENSTGRPCWNAVAILKYLEHFKKTNKQKAFDFVLTYHEADQRQRLVSVYLDSFLKGTDMRGRLHGQFHQHRVVTGRLSSSDPNLQNQAKSGGTADQKALERFLGVKNETALNRHIRSLFITEPGNVFVALDWQNLEYRIATYFARDEFMMKKFQENKDADYHQITADLLAVDRDVAKTLNFMTLYFGGAKALAATFTGMGRPCSEFEARTMLNKLFAARQPLKQLMDKSLREAREQGLLQNPFGRVCFVPSGLEYVWLNWKVQGSGGDLMRAALVRLYRLIKKNRWPVSMLLSVHDECGFEMPNDAVQEVVPKLADEMCRAPWFSGVPITCDMEAGPSWGELEAVQPEGQNAEAKVA